MIGVHSWQIQLFRNLKLCYLNVDLKRSINSKIWNLKYFFVVTYQKCLDRVLHCVFLYVIINNIILHLLFINLCESFNNGDTIIVMDLFTNTVEDKFKHSEYLNTDINYVTKNDEDLHIKIEEKVEQIKIYNPLTLR